MIFRGLTRIPGTHKLVSCAGGYTYFPEYLRQDRDLPGRITLIPSQHGTPFLGYCLLRCSISWEAATLNTLGQTDKSVSENPGFHSSSQKTKSEGGSERRIMVRLFSFPGGMVGWLVDRTRPRGCDIIITTTHQRSTTKSSCQAALRNCAHLLYQTSSITTNQPTTHALFLQMPHFSPYDMKNHLTECMLKIIRRID